ncbi:MAG: tRNA (adenosine(37)-N6)-threonylcarbamoyltransferase complex dimerization subunit type 1 TsaB, partial [Candidatus Omnitrophica bacterium]|nr:tRNA (adenosine(37)-N6)-threonylcarbamoyltransferase complex dimerization subunit type 1 TsaB [Candidatus Omnitrophota bacterium]
KILGIETSNKYLGLAIVEDGRLLAEYSLDTGRQHASLLVPYIDRILKDTGLVLDQIDGFSISLGPGSFTGLRIGLATVKGLALPDNKPIVGVPTLDVISANIIDPAQPVCVIVDAKRNQLYWAKYKYSPKGLKNTTGYNLSPVADVLKSIKTKTIITGDGIAAFGRLIIKEKPKLAVLSLEELWYPRGLMTAKLGYQRLIAGQKDDVDALEPMYLYSRDCSIRKNPKTKE